MKLCRGSLFAVRSKAGLSLSFNGLPCRDRACPCPRQL